MLEYECKGEEKQYALRAKKGIPVKESLYTIS